MGQVVGTPRLDRDRRKPKSGNFYVYWTDNIEGSKELSTRTNNHIEAVKFFSQWRQRNIGISLPRTIDEVLLNEILHHYKDEKRGRVKSIERIEGAILRLEPFWGARPASVVNGLTCKDYESYRFELHDDLYPLKETISINTIRRELGVFRAALNIAKKARLIDMEVFVDLPPEIQKSIEHFECGEAIGLIKSANKVTRAKKHLTLFLKIGFLTGRRKAAILNLRWVDIDFDANIIYWQPDGESETNKRKPIGALPNRLKRILQRYRMINQNDIYVISYQGQKVKDIKNSFKTAVEILREKIATQTGQNKEDVLKMAYPHMMRHSCATWLMQKGINKEEACQFLGMTTTTLDRRYWHHHPDYQRGPADAF